MNDRRQSINARQDCHVCSTPSQPCSISLKEWDVHVKSKSHKRYVAPFLITPRDVGEKVIGDDSTLSADWIDEHHWTRMAKRC